ncbi:MAG: GAF domain-containing protein, partial [Candidatus Dormibacteria bacterium]
MDDRVIVDLLGQVGNLFTSSLELKETIDFMLKAASELVESDAATVFLVDPDGEGLTAMATFPYVDSVGRVAHFALGEGIVGWAAARREVVSVADAVEDKRFKSLNMAHAPRSSLVMPLASPQRLVGALTVARRVVRPFTEVEQALIRIIGNQAAISIDNA